MPPGSKISILLVDDHPLVRVGLKTELSRNENFVIAGEATNGKEAIAKAVKVKPDVILLDINMPVMNGFEAAPILQKKLPHSKIIALTMHDNKNYIEEITRLGAQGYVLKDSSPEELFDTIYAVIKEKNSQAMSKDVNQSARRKKKLVLSDTNLSKREKEILVCVANGLTNKQIARKLFLSTRTVEAHRERIKRKLNIRSVADLIKYAYSKDLVRMNLNQLERS